MPVEEILLIIFIIIVLFGLLYVFTTKEGFQTVQPDLMADLIKRQFWDIVSKKDNPTVAAKIAKVRDPAPNDSLPITFANYISIYAMAKYNNDPVAARRALFSDYDMLQSELSNNMSDKSELNDWDTIGKEISCREIDNIFTKLSSFVKTIPDSVKDISGTIHVGASLRDENLLAQNKFKAQCNKTPMSAECIRLATQEDPIYPLLTKYNVLNYTLYDQEYDISNNLDILHKTYMLLQCKDENPNLTFNVDRDTQVIDHTVLMAKLQELSPYYISPETLKFITSSIMGSSEVKNTIQTTSDMYINIGNTINNIKTLTSGT